MHPAPGVHISMAGCTILEGVHPVCARFLSHLLLLYIGRVHGTISGCTVLWELHPASAQNNSLISDTVLYHIQCNVNDTDDRGPSRTIPMLNIELKINSFLFLAIGETLPRIPFFFHLHSPRICI